MPEDSKIALFSELGSTEISNLTVDGYVNGLNSVGGIGGYVLISDRDSVCVITNCHNKANIKGDRCVGGICGLIVAANSFYFCSNSGKVEGYRGVGGIIGQVPDGPLWDVNYIKNCNNFSNISSENGYVGGIIGQGVSTYIDYCNNYGLIIAKDSVAGGISGYQGALSMRHNNNYGDVYALISTAGGITGLNGNANYYYCNNYGNVFTVSLGYSGGICGKNYAGVVYNSVNQGQITWYTFAGGITGINFINGGVQKSINTGSINSQYCSGGITGSQNGTYQTVFKCLNIGCHMAQVLCQLYIEVNKSSIYSIMK